MNKETKNLTEEELQEKIASVEKDLLQQTTDAGRVALQMYVEYLEDCLKEADIIVVLTEWKNFSEIDVSLVSKIVRNRIVFDTRNVLNKNNWIREKFKLIEIGRH
mgnify:CR=1 FL=1